jgi:UDP-N-acetylmuramate dehydrogenase
MTVAQDKLMGLKSDVPIAEYTTIGLGGKAKYFISCQTVDEIRSAIEFGERENLRIEILGGGSNVIFPDEGFNGLVIKIDLKGTTFHTSERYTRVIASAGEVWDDLVKVCVEKNLAGFECLSGIPGSVGATPIQNVGAYGQEVKDTITSVRTLSRKSLEIVDLKNGLCEFGYRSSRFKFRDKDKYIILEVCYRLQNNGKPSLKYVELLDYVNSKKKETGMTTLPAVRDAVLELRKKKSMLVDPSDPNSKSVGSFFVNPVLSEVEYSIFKERLNSIGIGRAPSYKDPHGVKIPAAWLVENAGFCRGYKKNGVGISANHSLALVNFSGTAKEILSLASDIENAVLEKFGIALQKEAVVV